MLNENSNEPPLYMPARCCVKTSEQRQNEKEYVPSSGTIMSSKFRRSAGSANLVCIVEGRSSSVKSRAESCSKFTPAEEEDQDCGAYLSVLESELHSSLDAS